MNMDKLDRLVDLLDFDGLENSFDVINATVAVRMIDDKNTNNK
jgi:hypothetical protein